MNGRLRSELPATLEIGDELPKRPGRLIGELIECGQVLEVFCELRSHGVVDNVRHRSILRCRLETEGLVKFGIEVDRYAARFSWHDRKVASERCDVKASSETQGNMKKPETRKRVSPESGGTKTPPVNGRGKPKARPPRERSDYQIVVSKRVEKQIESLPLDIRRLVVTRIGKLAVDPRPSGCEALVGRTGQYRVRQGAYRIVYQVDDDLRLVSIANVAHRRQVYR